MDPQTLYQTQALYDGGIAYVDSEIGRLFEKLEERGLFERSLVILTADHGEEFQEHGSLLHSQFYEELIHVPLLIHLPDQQEPRRIQGVVGLVDLAPTLLELVSIEVPKSWEGRSLLGDLTEGQGRKNTLFFGGSHWIYGFREGDWKLLYNVETGKRDLFNLAEDPEERWDFSETNPDQLQKLWTSLKEVMPPKSRAPPRLAPFRSRELRSLGYLH